MLKHPEHPPFHTLSQCITTAEFRVPYVYTQSHILKVSGDHGAPWGHPMAQPGTPGTPQALWRHKVPQGYSGASMGHSKTPTGYSGHPQDTVGRR